MLCSIELKKDNSLGCFLHPVLPLLLLESLPTRLARGCPVCVCVRECVCCVLIVFVYLCVCVCAYVHVCVHACVRVYTQISLGTIINHKHFELNLYVLYC